MQNHPLKNTNYDLLYFDLGGYRAPPDDSISYHDSDSYQNKAQWYTKLRSEVLKDADVILVCFDLTDRYSLENTKYWIHDAIDEVKTLEIAVEKAMLEQKCSFMNICSEMELSEEKLDEIQMLKNENKEYNVPILLLGCKADLNREFRGSIRKNIQDPRRVTPVKPEDIDKRVKEIYESKPDQSLMNGEYLGVCSSSDKNKLGIDIKEGILKKCCEYGIEYKLAIERLADSMV